VPEIAENLCELIGASLEVIGAILLANRYLNKARIGQIPWALLSVIWKGKKAIDLAFASRYSQENALTSLRGILFLFLGFVIRGLPHLVRVIDYIGGLASR
jgi:hypothetical protein